MRYFYNFTTKALIQTNNPSSLMLTGFTEISQIEFEVLTRVGDNETSIYSLENTQANTIFIFSNPTPILFGNILYAPIQGTVAPFVLATDAAIPSPAMTVVRQSVVVSANTLDFVGNTALQRNLINTPSQTTFTSGQVGIFEDLVSQVDFAAGDLINTQLITNGNTLGSVTIESVTLYARLN